MTNKKAVAEKLLQVKAIKLNADKPFTWASGWKSPIYCDNRTVLSHPFERDFIKSELCNIIFQKFPSTEIIAAGGLILNENNEVLMIFRRGFWDLPKGKLDKGETIEQCAVREVKEETGLIAVEVVKFITVTQHEYFDIHSNADVLKETYWFEMKSTYHQKLIPQTEEDIVAIEWVNENKLNDHLQKSYANIQQLFKIWKYKN